MRKYEELIGLAQVQEAHERVIKCERDFELCQEDRRSKQEEIKDIQQRMKAIHSELDKTSRGQDTYLELLTEEHRIIKEEASLMQQFQALETRERALFNKLSTSVRESHERERESSERTKYWSIIGSIVGALIGIVGTTVNNRIRMRELHRLVQDSIGLQNERIDRALNDTDVSKDTQASEAFKRQESELKSELDEIKKLVILSKVPESEIEGESNFIYYGPDLQGFLDAQTEKIEAKFREITRIQAGVSCLAVGVGVFVIYYLFSS